MTVYPLERTGEEVRRLRIQAEALAFEAGVLLDLVGLGEGWRCLDLGCGAGGITDLLSRRVGGHGHVVGLDPDPVSLTAARAWAGQQRLHRVSFVQGDVFAAPLRAEAFDLVHVRYLMTTIGRHREVIEAALRLVRPGGWLAVEEADAAGLACYPDHPAWRRLRDVLLAAFARAGGDVFAGREVYRLLVEAGLEEVGFRPCQAGARRADPLADFLPATVLSTRPVILREGLASEAEIERLVAECRRHLSEPTTVHTSVIVIQAWGRKRRPAPQRSAPA
jgi:ubiquinone/menaquinone biosynthesis C-methylase UbiE